MGATKTRAIRRGERGHGKFWNRAALDMDSALDRMARTGLGAFGRVPDTVRKRRVDTVPAPERATFPSNRPMRPAMAIAAICSRLRVWLSGPKAQVALHRASLRGTNCARQAEPPRRMSSVNGQRRLVGGRQRQSAPPRNVSAELGRPDRAPR